MVFKDGKINLERYLGVYHDFHTDKDGTFHMITSMEKYLIDAVNVFMKEAGIVNLPFVPTPSLDDIVAAEDDVTKGLFFSSCSSHLMKVLYSARLCRHDLLVTTSFLARRVSAWGANEDRRLKRLMAYIWHHADLGLHHSLHPNDLKDAVLDFSPDAELGGDPYSTRATGGSWIEISSADGKRCWPVACICKKASHTSGSTNDSETTSLVGAQDSGLKREVIPILDHLETSLKRSVKLVCKEDNTQCIALVKRGFSPAMRYLKRHAKLSLGFVHEVFFPDLDNEDAPRYSAEIKYWPSTEHKGDWMTKELNQKDFINARERAGIKKYHG